MMHSIRTATAADIPVIQQLAEATWWPTYGSILSQEQLRYMLDKIYSTATLSAHINVDQQYLLLENETSAALGFASYSPVGPSTYKLNKLYVLSNLHGQGLGRMLLKEAERQVEALNAHTLILNVNRSNKAKGFYEKLGFTVTGKEDIDIGNGYFMNDYIMQKTL